MKKVYNLSDLSTATGIYMAKLQMLIDHKLIPAGDLESTLGKPKYSEHQFQKAIKAAKENELIKPTALARELGIADFRLRALVAAGKLPPAPVRIAETEYWYRKQIDDMEKVVEVVRNEPKVNPSDRRRADGFFSISDVAQAAGVARISVEHHIKHQRLNPPSHKLTGFTGFFYSTKDKNEIVKFFERRRKLKKEMNEEK